MTPGDGWTRADDPTSSVVQAERLAGAQSNPAVLAMRARIAELEAELAAARASTTDA